MARKSKLLGADNKRRHDAKVIIVGIRIDIGDHALLRNVEKG